MLFHRRGLAVAWFGHVTFGGSGGMFYLSVANHAFSADGVQMLLPRLHVTNADKLNRQITAVIVIVQKVGSSNVPHWNGRSDQISSDGYDNGEHKSVCLISTPLVSSKISAKTIFRH